MTQQPNVDKVYTGESVSFECEVELSSGWEYLWYKDGASLVTNSSSFKIHDANLLHSGIYECMARRHKTTYTTERSDVRTLRISGEPEKVTLCWCVLFRGIMQPSPVHGFHAVKCYGKNQIQRGYLHGYLWDIKKGLMCLFLLRNSCSIFEEHNPVVGRVPCRECEVELWDGRLQLWLDLYMVQRWTEGPGW